MQVLIVAPNSESLPALIQKADSLYGNYELQIVWTEEQAKEIQRYKKFDAVVRH